MSIVITEMTFCGFENIKMSAKRITPFFSQLSHLLAGVDITVNR